MPNTHTLTNRGLFTLLSTAISGTTDLRQAVFTGTAPTVAAIRDMNTLADLIADAGSAESALVARQDLGGVTLTENDTTDAVTFVSSAPSYGNIAAGETLTFVAYYIEAATDATRALISVEEPASSQITNGGAITGPAFSLTLTGS